MWFFHVFSMPLENLQGDHHFVSLFEGGNHF
jgi:hypothetical protein